MYHSMYFHALTPPILIRLLWLYLRDVMSTIQKSLPYKKNIQMPVYIEVFVTN